MGGETDYLHYSLTCLRTPTKLLKRGGGRIAPFYSINEKHSHLSNVLRECKILYQHTFMVGIRKNTQWHNNGKKKKEKKEDYYQ